ncbi:uncharacterized protein LOC123292297 [Chrysoperla carnea]|uniref:uncharacterized protein LOC123292297 n=1 Tax=Chrysoperla carnea TaxID=189513 RepID=UPI001D089291|nr:uncharacterized protein LOC123292297 [Chrysoperla carnea]
MNLSIISRNIRGISIFSRNLASGQIVYNKETSSSSTASPSVTTANVIPEVQGLSSACIKESSEKILTGTSKNGAYKNPEYFSYDKTSYFEAEIEMLKYRCPQPSAK